jgi:hypothetical protein
VHSPQALHAEEPALSAEDENTKPAKKPDTNNTNNANAISGTNTTLHVQSIVINLTENGLGEDESQNAKEKEKAPENESEKDKESDVGKLRRVKRKRRDGHATQPRNEEAINLDTHTSHTELLGTIAWHSSSSCFYCILHFVFFFIYIL